MRESKLGLVSLLDRRANYISSAAEATAANSQDRHRAARLFSLVWNGGQFQAPAMLYPAGKTLHLQDEYVPAVYLIAQGHVKLTRVERDGSEVIVAFRSSGWPLGSECVIACQPSPVTTVTLTPCRLSRLRVETFLDLVKNDREFSWYVQQIHAHELCEQMEQSGRLTTRARLEHLLRRLMEEQELDASRPEVRLQLPFKRREIADYLDITPEHFSRLLKDLEQEGLIRRTKGWLIVNRQMLTPSGPQT